jgi:N-acyl-D-amino-acid deacylase
VRKAKPGNDSQGTAPDGLLGKEHPRPRAYGTFPRILRKYVLEDHTLTPQDAIRRFSALPPRACAWPTRRAEGRHVGRHCGFRSREHSGPGDLRGANQLSEGMRFVLVNGVPVIEEGRMANALPGMVLRH